MTTAAAPALFSDEEYAARLARVRAGMAQRDTELLLLVGQENEFYLTGYQSTERGHPALILAVPAAGPLFLTMRSFNAPLARL